MVGELVEMPRGRWQGVDRGFTVTKANFHFFYVLCSAGLCFAPALLCSDL